MRSRHPTTIAADAAQHDIFVICGTSSVSDQLTSNEDIHFSLKGCSPLERADDAIAAIGRSIGPKTFRGQIYVLLNESGYRAFGNFTKCVRARYLCVEPAHVF